MNRAFSISLKKEQFFKNKERKKKRKVMWFEGVFLVFGFAEFTFI